MSDRDALWAFLAVLVAIIFLAVCGTLAINHDKDPTVYGSAIVGLVGVIGTFRPRGAAGTSASTDSGDVTVNTPTEPKA